MGIIPIGGNKKMFEAIYMQHAYYDISLRIHVWYWVCISSLKHLETNWTFTNHEHIIYSKYTLSQQPANPPTKKNIQQTETKKNKLQKQHNSNKRRQRTTTRNKKRKKNNHHHHHQQQQQQPPPPPATTTTTRKRRITTTAKNQHHSSSTPKSVNPRYHSDTIIHLWCFQTQNARFTS